MRNKMVVRFVLVITGLIFVQAGICSDVMKWDTNGKVLCNAVSTQDYSSLCPDGSGGAIVVWEDSRGADKDIYAQAVDANGNIKWASNGVVICNASGGQGMPVLCPDGLGGAIIVWKDSRTGSAHIYAQRVDSSGNVKWTTNGETIYPYNTSSDPRICSDGSGGAIIEWINTNYIIYAQRINRDGVIQWTANGETVCTVVNARFEADICPDGSGGAIIVWGDQRIDNCDIYAQRIDGNGDVRWTTAGETIASKTGIQSMPRVCPDGSGGAVIAWSDFNAVAIRAQHINAEGNVQWSVNGETVSGPGSSTYCRSLEICRSNSGDVIVAWADEPFAHCKLYA